MPGEGKPIPIKLRSMVGLIPLFAVEILDAEALAGKPDFDTRLKWLLKYDPKLAALVSHWDAPGAGERRLLSLLRADRMKAVLSRMLDETEFLSDYGIRSLSRHYLDDPYTFSCVGQEITVGYVPGESDAGLFGGNSNWRGPIWMPLNFLIIESLRRFHAYYGDDLKVECPVGSGRELTLEQVADELCRRLMRIFLPGPGGARPAFGDTGRFEGDPNFHNHLQFHEYFHGDTGKGLGASHQTGWTGLIASLISMLKTAPESTATRTK